MWQIAKNNNDSSEKLSRKINAFQFNLNGKNSKEN
jgi:hypothetical protein